MIIIIICRAANLQP